MKKKLCKSRKYSGSLGVVLYSSEGEPNNSCTFDTNCNTKIFCGLESRAPDGVNYRCNPPESTRDGARNVRCNLAVNC
jgi:hypothetical protein